LSLAATATPAPDRTAPAAGDPDAQARNDYAISKSLGTVAAWDAFLQRHPEGIFADVARAEREKLPSSSVSVVREQPRATRSALMPSSRRQSCAPRSSGDSVARYCVSSVRPSEDGNTYGPLNLFGAAAAAWVPQTSGYAIGEWILIEFDRMRSVTGFSIRNGYQKDSDIFYKNSRVRALDVRTSEGEEISINLNDGFDAQKFRFQHPLKTRWIAFTIRAVFAGTKFTDTAVSKLDVDFAE
jgi:hypothetical protein